MKNTVPFLVQQKYPRTILRFISTIIEIIDENKNKSKIILMLRSTEKEAHIDLECNFSGTENCLQLYLFKDHEKSNYSDI